MFGRMLTSALRVPSPCYLRGEKVGARGRGAAGGLVPDHRAQLGDGEANETAVPRGYTKNF